MTAMGSGAWTLHAPLMMLLIAVATPSEASNCINQHPQTLSCTTNFAIKGQFLNFSSVILPEYQNFSYPGYTIKAEKVFKGNISEDVFFVYSFAYTPYEYKHSSDNFHKDYLITIVSGKSVNYVSSCCFIKPWSELSSGQIKGFKGGYAKECGCEVTTCFKPPCPTTKKQCAFVQYDKSAHLDQEQNQICAKNDNGNCIWKTII